MVKGLTEFNRRWSAIPVNVRKAARDTLEQNANEIVADMKRFAPVRDEFGGTLRDSINWTWGDAPEGAMVIGTVGGKDYSTLRITIYAGGADAFYAVFQEFGTKDMPANPFFYPVWRTRKRRVKSRLTRNINKAIKEA